MICYIHVCTVVPESLMKNSNSYRCVIKKEKKEKNRTDNFERSLQRGDFNIHYEIVVIFCCGKTFLSCPQRHT